MAESWSASDDAKVWVFKIRKGVTFHNGKEMFASDVVWSLSRHAGKKSKSGAHGIMTGLESWKATGKHEVTITLKTPNADLPYLKQ